MNDVNEAVILTEMDDDSIFAKIMAYLKKDAGGEDIYIPDEEVKHLISKYEKLTGSKVTFNGSSSSGATVSVSSTMGMAYNIWTGIRAVAQSFYEFSNGNEDEGGKHLRDYGFQLLTGTSVSIFAEAAIVTFSVTNFWAALAILVVASAIGTELGDNLSDLFDTIFNLYDDAGAYTYPVDPLIFDLDSDGIETVSLKDGVNFDFDNNGFAEKIGWVSADDGLLVRDLNGNGNIDNGGELFGDLTAVAEGINAVNGFEALAAFDVNADGVINTKDAIYSELKIWQDRNQNGTVDEGELLTLQEAGIAGIGLDYETINEMDEQGNVHTQKGYYIKADGSTALVEDVWFDKDAADTTVVETTLDMDIEISEDVMKLPDIQGKGNQYSLHQAMMLDETGELKRMVESYIAEESSEIRKSMIPDIIYLWTGVADVDITSRGNYISDARKLEALEVITGRKFDSAYGTNPVYQAGKYLEQAFSKLVDLYYGQLEMQTIYAEEYAEMYMNMDVNENGELILDFASVAQKYLDKYASDAKEKKHILEFVDNLMLTGIDSCVGRDVINTTFSVVSTDICNGVKYYGDDTIAGTSGDDLLIGETGNDTLRGGNGNDTYVFHLGDGEDTIMENSGTDTIRFGEGIREEDILVARENNHLSLTNIKSGDRIVVEEFFYDVNRQVEKVEFADGNTWSLDDLKDKARYYYGGSGDDRITGYNSNSKAPTFEDDYLYGGAGNDTLYGQNGNDELYGEEGADTLYGGNGNDVLTGGKGNDTLNGQNGDDTYVFHLGDGQDTIVENSGTDTIRFGEGIREEDILVARENNHLSLTNVKSGDRIVVEEFFYNAGRQIEKVEFADGSSWDIEVLKDKARYYYGGSGDDRLTGYNSNSNAPTFEDDYLYGGAGNDTLYGQNGNDELYGEEGADTLYGGNGNDVLSGGAGEDYLYGQNGDDTYVFHLGDGQDTIVENSGTDTIRFGEGIREEDILVARENNHLSLTNVKSGDRIVVEEFFYNAGRQIEKVEFADGSSWDIEVLKDKARYYYGGSGDDRLTGYNSNSNAPTFEDDYLYGGAGNDTLYGQNGNDELYGEEGADTLYGGNGNDVLSGGAGEDYLYGQNGDDTYVFHLGDGQDTIVENSGTDTIRFGEGIREEDILVARENNHLSLTNVKSGDRIVVEEFFYNAGRQIEKVEFADGSSWDIEVLKDKARYYYGGSGDDRLTGYNSNSKAPTFEDDYLYGGAGNDTLYGNNGNDELYGEEGDDTLYGGNGNDLLSGGAGEDYLYGQNGDDTYIFNLGDGADIINDNNGYDRVIFGEGIVSSDVTFLKERNNLVVSVRSGDSITVLDYFSNDNYKIESFQTFDGSELDVIIMEPVMMAPGSAQSCNSSGVNTGLNVMIQAMASFEDTTGMMWEDAVEQKNEQTNDSLNQWWTKEAI